MPILPSPVASRRPTVDEWGVYDPQQAGLAALFIRLTPPHGPQPESTATVPPATGSKKTTPDR